jgi:flavin reductase (DIM6/NTAB) family NADH-FMN oxidoreductase RutF
MGKQLWKPSTILNPVPVVMVTSVDGEGKPNIITLAWVGTVNSDPPMLSISVRKERYSYDLIKNKGQFVVNLTTKKLAFATDLCGVKSGRDTDKFEAAKLTPEKASVVDAPLIKESPVNIECIVKERLELGSHDMFIGEIVAVHVDDKLLDEKEKLCLDEAGLICYSHGEYWSLDKSLGYFGYSVTKKKNLKRENLKIKINRHKSK